MFGSFLAIVIKGNYDVGGAGVVFDRNYQSGRIGELGLTQEQESSSIETTSQEE
jgi:hypothetical protein